MSEKSDSKSLADAPQQWSLRETVTRLRAISDQSMVGFCRMEGNGAILDCNPAFARMLGRPWQKLVGLCLHDLSAPGDQGAERAALTHAQTEGRKELLTRRRFVHENGPTVWVDLALTFVDGNGAPATMFAAALDVTEQVYIEGALARSEKNFRQLFDTMTSGCALHRIICDDSGKPVDYRFLSINPAFEAQTGLKAADLVGKTVKEALPGTEDFWIETYGEVALTGEPVQFEHYSNVLDRHFLVSAYCPERLLFAVIFNDITEQKRVAHEREQLERQVLHAQKLESLGVLAGGIAHDFNNLLMAILGSADLAMSALPAASPARRDILEIEKASRQAADLCRQMLAYSGKGEFVVEPINICELIQDMQGMLKVSISKRAALRLSLAKIPAIMADPSQIQQVMMNLIINASEAIGDESGIITVSSGTMQCGDEYLRETYVDEQLEEGEFVYVEVSDNGCGMAPEARDRIFDPFYTTKFTGRGLGLAAVLGIIRGHGGAIKVYSEEGKGTTFKVLLPASDAESRRTPSSINGKDYRWHGSGAVLLVDDEEFVIEIGGRMLRHLGFTVLAARNGREAVECYKASQEDIVCVLLDLTMPVMDGHEAYRELRTLNPDVCVVLSSGYNERDAIGQFNGKGLSGFIQKPYQMEDLRQVLHDVLT